MPSPRPPDLDSPEQIAELVRRFYADVAQDDLLGPVFEDVAQVDWSEHLTTLTAFWSRLLLGQRGYDGNPLAAHRRIHARHPFTEAHFERWLELFTDTVTAGWSGPHAEQALRLATNVARVHRGQLLGDGPGGELAGAAPTAPIGVPLGRSRAAGTDGVVATGPHGARPR